MFALARPRIVVSVLAALGILGIAVLVSELNRKHEGSVAGTQNRPPQIVGSIPYWDQPAAIASFKAHASQFNFITVFWYVLRRDGSVAPYPHAAIDSSLISYAHQRGVKVFALIANLPAEDEGGDWDRERVQKVIASPGPRKKHVADIMALVRQHGFDGIHIDYEALRKSQRTDFTRFISELSTALHREGKLLSVSLHPKVGENNPRYSNGSEAQDWKALARSADQLRVMTIEQHWDTSSPGPAASRVWMEPILKYAQKLIPPEKLFVVMPLYGYDWTDEDTPAEGLTYAQVQELITRHDPEILWDESATSHYFTYEEDGQTHTVWYEDAQSTAARLKLLQNLGLKNLAFWRLGHEDAQVWNVLK